MDIWSHGKMSGYFLNLYRVELPHLFRELGVREEESPSSFIHLLKTKMEVRLMEKTLAEKDEAFRERMKVIVERWRALHAKRAQLKDHVQKSGKIIKENEEVRILALKIDSKEREENMQKESELLKAKMKLEALRKEHLKLCKKVQKYSVFKKYLEDVVKISQFEDILEVTSRYALLVRTHKDLLQSQQGHKDLTEQDKVLLEQYRAEKEAEMLQYKSKLAQLKLRFDQAQTDIRLWETCWTDIQNRTSKKTKKLWAIKLAIHDLFQSTNMRLNADCKVSVDDSLKQLDMIKQFIQYLKDIHLCGGQEEAPASNYTDEAKGDLTCPDNKVSVGWEGKEENPTDIVD
ncbi:coiled-coil domain-containing protein 42-like isoform X1 [Pseudopipra pipra]|uniref:coiled-coil domain-containing protein 42-like isoform X1 n=1 Tax=Pseudopipra pipra TaxID=415032 RepID=UPI0031394978